MNIGKRIRVKRKDAGMSQEELARRAGMSLNGFAQIERGLIPDPHYSSLSKIADGLGMPIGKLLEDSPKVEAPTSSTPAEAGKERRTIADSVEDYMRTRALGHDREVRDPESEHFRDATAATLWLSGVQGERRELAEWIGREVPVFSSVMKADTLKASFQEALKIAGHLMTFYRVISMAESRIAEMGAADELVTKRLARDSAAAEEVGPAREDLEELKVASE